ncbi:MAG: hypothetical protein ACRCU5_04640 [Rhizobiaceae bacterium]
MCEVKVRGAKVRHHDLLAFREEAPRFPNYSIPEWPSQFGTK